VSLERLEQIDLAVEKLSEGVAASETALEIADLRWEKAELVEALYGADAAIELFEMIVRDMERVLASSREADTLSMLICAQNAIAVTHKHAGRPEESARVASILVREHFASTPDDAVHAIANAVFTVVGPSGPDMTTAQTVELLDDLRRRYGSLDHDDGPRISAVAELDAGIAYEDAGELELAAARYDRVIALAKHTDRVELQLPFAQALVSHGRLALMRGDRIDADRWYAMVIDRFSKATDDELLTVVGWARDHRRELRSRGLLARLRRR
jgi:tetratricopeptide (TPR) repeat protein